VGGKNGDLVAQPLHLEHPLGRLPPSVGDIPPAATVKAVKRKVR
jgi:hypothetical protein